MELKPEQGIFTIAYVNSLADRINELESELKLNSSMLAKQCDLARGAETENQLLRNAIEKHRVTPVITRVFVLDDDTIASIYNRDKELYAVLERGV